MSTDASQPTDAPPAQRTTRSGGLSAGRLITWAIIAILAGVAGIEATAKFGYEGTLGKLEKLDFSGNEGGIAAADIDAVISGWTHRTTDTNGQVSVNWVSLVKDYGVTLIPEPGQADRFGSYETSGAAGLIDEAPSMPEGFKPGALPPNPTAGPPADGSSLGNALKVPAPPGLKTSPLQSPDAKPDAKPE